MFREIIEKVEEANRILITSHLNPDGDAIGAGLALYLALEEYNKKKKAENNEYSEKIVRFVLEDKIPNNLMFLQGIEMIEKDKNVASKYEFDLVIFVDAATKDRVGGAVRHIGDNTFTINIDHHTSNTMYADINYVEDISSTCEIIYNFIREMESDITLEIGEALYTGLVNDTGNFAHSNVTPKTLHMAADLMEKGVDNSKIVREFFSNKSYASLKIMGMALQGMSFVEEKKLTYFYLSRDALVSLGGTKEDSDGLVSLINSFDEAEVSLFLREEVDGRIKGSLRSKHDIDVNKIAGIFGGGGHVKASGFSAEGIPVEEIIKKVVEAI